MNISDTDAQRLRDIVRVLAARARDGSAALPQGRGGKDHLARLEILRIWEIDANRILGEE